MKDSRRRAVCVRQPGAGDGNQQIREGSQAGQLQATRIGVALMGHIWRVTDPVLDSEHPMKSKFALPSALAASRAAVILAWRWPG